MSHDTEALVTEHHDRLVSLAYRMVGRMTEAQDVVQETWERWAAADHDTIDNPGGWLTTVCTRRCLDLLRSAARQRETYVGPWLPEPILTEDLDLSDAAAMGESVTLAFLVVLESLSPLERVAFLLHDVFGYEHDAVATMVGRSPAAVRQLVARARRHVESRRPRFESDASRRWEVAEAFLAAANDGAVDELVSLLAPDIVFTSDGGGKATAARRPVEGPERVARFLLGIISLAPDDAVVRMAAVNGMPAVVAEVGGEPNTVIVLDIADGVVTAIRAVRNPHKLGALRRP